MRKLKAALENAIVEQTQQNTEEAIDIVSDLNFEQGYQQDCVGQIDQAIETASSLEDILVAATPTNPEDKVPETTQRVLAVAVEQACIKLGISSQSISMEEDGDTTLEKAKKFVKRLWEMIIDAFNRAYDFISDYLAMSFNAAARIEKAAVDKLRESRKLTGAPKKTTYRNKDMARALSGDPSVGLIYLFDRTLDLTEIATRAAYMEPAKKIEKLVSQLLDGSESEISADKFSEELMAVVQKSYSANFLKVTNGDTNLSSYGVPDGVDVLMSPELMGSMAAVLMVPKGIDSISSFGFKIIPVDSDSEESEINKDIPISDLREQDQLLKMVIQNCGQIRKFQKDISIFNDIKNRYLDSKKIANALNERAEKITQAEQTKLLRVIASTLPKIIQGIHHRAFAFSLNNSRTILKHIDYSMAAWK